MSPMLRKPRLIASSIYVLSPAFIGLVCSVGYFFGGVDPTFDRGLLLGMLLGIVPGVPLAFLQLAAVWSHNRSCARIISLFYWAALVILALGVLQVAIIGTDDESPITLVPDVVIMTSIMAMTLLTAYTMGQFAQLLETKDRAIKV